jgi:RecA-family ATPase
MSDEDGQIKPPLGRKLSELSNHSENDPNELLKFRFLCAEGVLALVGQTGIGKSSISMQMKMQWALQREAFGFVPAKPLKSLLIQAENDEGDLAEMRDGIITGYKLTPEEAKAAGDNIITIQEDSLTGKDFFELCVKPALAEHRPDLLWLDNVLAYLGGDILSQKDVTQFLRNYLKPCLKEYNCGCIFVHHTNKTGRSDTAYAGSGSAEFGNMPRAVVTLTERSNAIFELMVTKRSKRLLWKKTDGKTYRNSLLLRHSLVDGLIFWEPALDIPEADINRLDKKQDQENIVLSYVPEGKTIEKNLLEVVVNQKGQIGVVKTHKTIQRMIKEGTLVESFVPRSNARPEIHISRAAPKT